MLNFHAIFSSTTANNEDFISKLDLSAEQEAIIKQAKEEIRECLRQRLPAVLVEQGVMTSDQAPKPRFFTQGSNAYGTLNAPAKPGQQADIDDGAYLPLSFVSQADKPSIAAAAFFAAAEAALMPLVIARRWQLITDKATCIRVEISTTAHVDIPLYAIPDKEFQTITAKAFDHGYRSLEEAMQKADQDTWDLVPENKVLLAHREQGWKLSDPRPLKHWFLGAVSAKGEQLRRVVRYLKAFRDWQWDKGGPSSVLLMAAAVPLFEQKKGRDDLALLHVVERLPGALQAGVKHPANPADPNESLTDNYGATGVAEAAIRFTNLKQYLVGAIHGTNSAIGIAWLQEQFGDRIPDRPDLVTASTPAQAIAATPAKQQASQIVRKTDAA